MLTLLIGTDVPGSEFVPAAGYELAGKLSFGLRNNVFLYLQLEGSSKYSLLSGKNSNEASRQARWDDIQKSSSLAKFLFLG